MNLETLRALCLSLPAVTEDVKWGHDLCFSVGGKMFCVASMEPPFSFSLKVTPAEFEELVGLPHVVPAPYLARNHWVLLQEGHLVGQPLLEKYLRQSYELVKAKLPKKDRVAAGL